MDRAGMAEARGAPLRPAPNIMNVTPRTDVILNIGDSLKFPSSVDVPGGMTPTFFDPPTRHSLDRRGCSLTFRASSLGCGCW